MPSYFFHLGFELYPPTALQSILSLEPLANESTAGPCFIPPKGFDIFNTEALPDHTSKGGISGTLAGHINAYRKPEAVGEVAGLRPESHKAITLRKSTGKRNKYIDFRFGRVSLESVDLVLAGSARNTEKVQERPNMGPPITNNLLKPTKTVAVSKPTSATTTATATTITEQNKHINRGTAGAVSPTPKARFIALNSKTTEFGYGVVHLYRDHEKTEGIYPTPGAYEAVNGGASAPSSISPARAMEDGSCENNKQVDEDALKTVAILAVPSYMTASDFMGYVGEETRVSASHFRMIRTGQANRYMVLIRFRQAEKAKEFVMVYNGKAFNSMEPENCHVVFIKSIQFISSSSLVTDVESFPGNTLNDPFFPTTIQPSIQPSTASLATSTAISTKPAPPPTPSLLELPTCPVCLERMDETTGLLTILCQHVFHCSCLSKWKDNTCPVCRYSQAGVIGRSKGVDATENEEFCDVCGTDTNLWICLICRHIGCGRYDDAHAFQHYLETSHTYAMDVDTQRVWDYAGDGYVHRLIQNQSDGKLVELPSATDYADPASGDYVPREKLDKIGMEYTYLLTSQLDSQRAYFEEKVAQAADKAASALKDAERWHSSAATLEVEFEQLKVQHDTLTNETMAQLVKDKDRAERKAEKFAEMSKRLEKEWKEEKVMNSSLLEKVEYLTKQSEERLKEGEDLKEQIRDLMFFIDAREKLKGGGEDIQEGTVTVAEAPEKRERRKKKGSRR